HADHGADGQADDSEGDGAGEMGAGGFFTGDEEMDGIEEQSAEQPADEAVHEPALGAKRDSLAESHGHADQRPGEGSAEKLDGEGEGGDTIGGGHLIGSGVGDGFVGQSCDEGENETADESGEQSD